MADDGLIDGIDLESMGFEPIDKMGKASRHTRRDVSYLRRIPGDKKNQSRSLALVLDTETTAFMHDLCQGDRCGVSVNEKTGAIALHKGDSRAMSRLNTASTGTPDRVTIALTSRMAAFEKLLGDFRYQDMQVTCMKGTAAFLMPTTAE